jgi:hypothetical protein
VAELVNTPVTQSTAPAVSSPISASLPVASSPSSPAVNPEEDKSILRSPNGAFYVRFQSDIKDDNLVVIRLMDNITPVLVFQPNHQISIRDATGVEVGNAASFDKKIYFELTNDHILVIHQGANTFGNYQLLKSAPISSTTSGTFVGTLLITEMPPSSNQPAPTPITKSVPAPSTLVKQSQQSSDSYINPTTLIIIMIVIILIGSTISTSGLLYWFNRSHSAKSHLAPRKQIDSTSL